MSFEINITPEIKRQFASEVTEHLDNLEKMLMALEKEPTNEEAINSAFRSVHSIKGNSAYIGIEDISGLTHELESLMDGVRSRKVTITRGILSLVFECIDLLRDMNHHVTDEEYKERDISNIISRIENIRASVEDKGTRPARQRDKVDIGAVFVRSSSQHVEFIKELAGGILAGESAKGAKANILRILKTFHTSANYAGFSHIAAVLKEIENKVEEAKSVRKDMAEYLLNRFRDIEALVAEIERPEPVEDESTVMGETVLSEALSREIRIEPEKLDELINHALELIIAKNTLNYLTEKMLADGAIHEWRDDLRSVSANIDKTSDDLQTSVMGLRLVKINSLFQRLPRIVRDLSLKSKKKIELFLLGRETEIDSKVIQHLASPIVHLMRNAVDHGIEPPAERIRKGKVETGSITVRAGQEGNHVIIDVIDDGRGLNVDEIKKEAVSRKIVTQEDLESMTHEEIVNLILTPGYSTTAAANLVSGRGVGLDIVKNNVNLMGGDVIISSEPDMATQVRLRVPFTMAVTDVLLTEVSGEQYAFPLSAVLESIKVKRGRIQALNKRETIPYRGTILSIKHLREILGITKSEKLRIENSEEELNAIVITFGGLIHGIIVDRILKRETVLSKPLEQHLSRIKEFSGASLLGDGSIALIVDPMGILGPNPELR